ncbi:unnamed protein product [Triticum turgidum subsp. durum]|uniref:Exonuclease V, chloroplastic n=1 Tax=Triticum turgidum subsp. durum TaxID=4567 RepID=A0A9R0Z4N4_TRITD|nr:unnamed protein product [Triticum turgidum subsp. durum]
MRPELEVEIVSDEEMAIIEAALAAAAAARPLLSAATVRGAATLSCAAFPPAGDIEDSAPPPPRRSLLSRFREGRALAVTDITATEWCDKQMEFVLEHGKPERTEAMKAGSDRHAQLEQEVIERVDIAVRSAEESWAVKFMNFIVGSNQLLFNGMTRELPVIGVVEGSWMVGIIDELRMPVDGISFHPILVDTKTRFKATIPSEAQKRNGRLQLMCYKITCHTLSRSQEQLSLRYELQEDHSLLEEYQFSYDAQWFKGQIQEALNFWRGAREAKYVTEEEGWKCKFCKFVPSCPKMPSTSRC